MSMHDDEISSADAGEASEQAQREDVGAVARAKAIILQRRNAFMTAALAGMGMAVTNCASVCLSIENYDAGADAPKNTAPDAPKDTGPDAVDGRPESGLPMPRVCLSFPPPDAGVDAADDARLDAKDDGSTT